MGGGAAWHSPPARRHASCHPPSLQYEALGLGLGLDRVEDGLVERVLPLGGLLLLLASQVLLPLLAWQTKLSLDAEPDDQRLLAATAVGGPGREIAAGLCAALGLAVVPVTVGLVLPWLLGAVDVARSGPLPAAIGFGIWLQVLSTATGLAIGAWASRAVSPDLGRATLTLVGGSVAVLALGSGAGDPFGWLVPRLTAVVRAGNDAEVLLVVVQSVHGLAWVGMVLACYVRTRSTTRP